MGKQKEKAVKEKPLDRMTAKELRELALTLQGIVGVHAMNKDELIAAIKEVKGIVDEKTKKATVDIRAIKAKIKDLRAKQAQAKEQANTKLIDSLRRRISNLKKRTRRAA
jgi:predicted  nucleic acid-binding Zn-ribbon protein